MAENTQAESYFTNTLGTQQLQEEISDQDHIEPRQANLFLIDTSPAMFETSGDNEESPFMSSILLYKNNMQMLCAFNRDDQMSLMLFATNEWDQNPETRNVFTVQKFHKVTLEMLKEIKGKIENNAEYFNLLSSPTEYPLHDALWHAAQAFSAVRTVVISRKIILLTCQDNPYADNQGECNRIRARVATFKNLGIDFRVIGLKNGFNHISFYKDLEIISSGMNSQIYKPLQLNDLEAEIQFPSRTISNISWMFSQDVVVPVSIYTISTETKFPDQVYCNKENNEILKGSTVFKKTNEEFVDDSDDEGNEVAFDSKIVAPGGLAKFQEHGGRKIVADSKELNSMFNHFTKGIETLCFKPIECDPMYHVEGPKFLTIGKTEASESQKQIFDTLVDRCVARELMIVTRVTARIHSTPSLYYLYPDAGKGGFYMYKMAYEDHVRNLDKPLSTWIYKDDWPHYPDEGATDIFEKIVKKTRIKYDPKLFRNPRLETLVANIEALALELNEVSIPPDSTLPSKKLEQRLEEILPEYRRYFSDDDCEVPAKRMRLMDDAVILDHIRDRTVNKLTVAALKEFLVHKNVPVGNAKKAELVDKVYQFHQNR
ncbi:X-ray repair cross-complementing protein 6 [Leptopilina heterotoma]|uniref:X-ray repair cross-complementing protein 6 n=1 Tax=Leptopilina heterotoma TaxID=63436 RepID=UPI001CA91F9A|nr:X-ray repair cross-complementing protein 6 [Leptopilina heterotoma]